MLEILETIKKEFLLESVGGYNSSYLCCICSEKIGMVAREKFTCYLADNFFKCEKQGKTEEEFREKGGVVFYYDADRLNWLNKQILIETNKLN
tara:strand:+ start:2147 stop:2425 length:279 start_codon:yes stop_codon:yes gene_type:complete